jgi:hypothetical protein
MPESRAGGEAKKEKRLMSEKKRPILLATIDLERGKRVLSLRREVEVMSRSFQFPVTMDSPIPIPRTRSPIPSSSLTFQHSPCRPRSSCHPALGFQWC